MHSIFVNVVFLSWKTCVITWVSDWEIMWISCLAFCFQILPVIFLSRNIFWGFICEVFEAIANVFVEMHGMLLAEYACKRKAEIFISELCILYYWVAGRGVVMFSCRVVHWGFRYLYSQERDLISNNHNLGGLYVCFSVRKVTVFLFSKQELTSNSCCCLLSGA